MVEAPGCLRHSQPPISDAVVNFQLKPNFIQFIHGRFFQ